MRACFRSLLLTIIFTEALSAEQVIASEGNIILRGSSGRSSVLTTSGQDSDPWLSPDNKLVVFLRRLKHDIFRTSVYAVDLDSRVVTRLFTGPAKYAGRENFYFGRPELDRRGSTLFLLSKEYSTESSLIAVHLEGEETTLIADHVVGYDVIQCPSHQGDLIVLKRHQSIQDRPFFVYWLYSTKGEELGLAGGEDLGPEYISSLRAGTCESAVRLPPTVLRHRKGSTESAYRVDETSRKNRSRSK